jgi:LmbE family N-acetylglucosaminyl deacetylase
MPRSHLVKAAAAALATLVSPPLAPAQQLAPPGTGGVAALDRVLARLTQNRRVLLIAAHPDDEDTDLLTLLSRGAGVDAAYLSLSRGEGGQNLIGPELGAALGVIRTGELLAARQVDGARQYFTRAFDFGFSKSLRETLEFWPRDTLLADVMRVIRRFRPQVIVSTWSERPREGPGLHGQHHAAGVVAHQAFRLARDSTWGPRKLYRSARFDSAAATLVIEAGVLDPLAGQSYHQLAMAGRSLHRSQDMGQLQRVGPAAVRLALVETAASAAPGRAAAEQGRSPSLGGAAGQASSVPSGDPADAMRRGVDALFEGVDTSPPPGLERYAALIDSARAALTPRSTLGAVPHLASALNELRRAGGSDFRSAGEPLLEEALAAAAGVVVDAFADDGRVTPGQTLGVQVSVWNAAGAEVRLDAVELIAPQGWNVASLDASAASVVGRSEVETRRFRVRVGETATPSTPYFLELPHSEGLYDWSRAPESLWGEPFDPPLLAARAVLSVAGGRVEISREVAHRFNDQALGEVRRPLAIVPPVGVTVEPDVMVWPVDGGGGPSARSLTVTLVHGARGRTQGEVSLEPPPGWPAVRPQPFVLEGEEARRSFTFEVRAPRALVPGRYRVRAAATANGLRDHRATTFMDYSHIRPVAMSREAATEVSVAELVLPRLTRIGYVRGASDLVPEHLAAVGIPLAVLTPSDLERADLSRFDAIVVGSRAYETEPALTENNARLLDYVRGGGRLIVLYQQYQFVRGAPPTFIAPSGDSSLARAAEGRHLAAYPLTIGFPHDRVTDERAPVRVLHPAGALFNTPNRITAADWEGWVQERGLYFAREWDAAYRPMIETGDDGEALRGGLLVARYGRGVYVYTALSFFRQLPAGVPGAYRLFANLLALRAEDVP